MPLFKINSTIIKAVKNNAILNIVNIVFITGFQSQKNKREKHQIICSLLVVGGRGGGSLNSNT